MFGQAQSLAIASHILDNACKNVTHVPRPACAHAAQRFPRDENPGSKIIRCVLHHAASGPLVLTTVPARTKSKVVNRLTNTELVTPAPAHAGQPLRHCNAARVSVRPLFLLKYARPLFIFLSTRARPPTASTSRGAGVGCTLGS